MDRVDAEELLHESIQNANLRKHCYAAEDVLRGLARHFGQNEELWAMTGLVHDIDYELTAQTPERHGATAADWLTQRGYDPALVRAVQSHNPATGVYPTTLLEKALYCADPVTGFIVAAALVSSSAPCCTVVGPVYVFVPPSDCVAGPVLVTVK